MYVVKKDVGVKGTPDRVEEYLCVINYNPYHVHDGLRQPAMSSEVDEAFLFRTEAAAEMAAVFIGGKVIDKDGELFVSSLSMKLAKA